MKLVERAYICPYIVLIDDDEGLENVDASFERYGEWDVEPRDKSATRTHWIAPRRAGRERTGGTNSCSQGCSSPLWHQPEKRRIAAAETAHTAAPTKESMSTRSFTGQWPGGVNDLFELKGRK